MVFVLYETIIFELFSFANTNNFTVVNINLKSLSNLG